MQGNMQPLTAAHFKPAGQELIAANPMIVKLAAKIAEAIPAVLANFGTTAPRVTLDAAGSVKSSANEDGATALRFESRSGSMSARIMLDRTMVFAMCEQALGGTGTEDPIAESERPFSTIETELRKLIVSSIAGALTGALSQVLATPFSLFEDVEADDAPGPMDQVNFRYLVNIFSYSGELRLSIPQQELALQIGAASKPLDDSKSAEDQRDLQRQIAGAPVAFQISLEPETVCVGDIIALRPGSLLKLTAAMTSPVIVSSDGVDVFSAALIHLDDHIAVRLIGPVR